MNDMSDQIKEAEAAFREHSLEIPEGYDRAGMALTDTGPRLFITGPDAPPMYWCGKCNGWQAVIPRNEQ